MLGDLGKKEKRGQDIMTLVKFIAAHIWEHENQRKEAKALLEASSSKKKVSAKFLMFVSNTVYIQFELKHIIQIIQYCPENCEEAKEEDECWE